MVWCIEMDLREQTEPGANEPTPDRDPASGTSRADIRCPQCSWQHDWEAHWGCELCETVFDTFVTHAICPEKTCGNSWKLTWCPMCQQPSPHEDWYVREAGTGSSAG
jgi:hypothetical protein